MARKSRNDFWILYAVLAAISLIFSLLYVIHIWILPRTPMFLIMILLSIPMLMLACKGVLIISRYAVFTVFFTLWMPLLLFIPLKDGHWIYLLPLLKEGWIPVLNTVKSTIIAFLGFEFAFVLYPYLNNKSSAKKRDCYRKFNYTISLSSSHVRFFRLF
ncbi:GerAB/ArcD/ProY family transporter [Bacillus pacificus]